MIEQSNLLKALYDIHKKQITHFYMEHPNQSEYSESYVFAIYHDCFPFFDSEEDDAEEIFEHCEFVTRSFATEVLTYLDSEWCKRKYYTFYEIENKFGGHHKNRGELIILLRYVFLSKKFDTPFWDKLNENAPSEAAGITDERIREWELPKIYREELRKMRIDITQHIFFEGDNMPYSWSKVYESEIKPRIGEFIEDPIWKNPYEYKVREIRNNYNENIVFVEVEDFCEKLPLESKDEIAHMAQLHGWKASWER